jgi:hypothetical protein
MSRYFALVAASWLAVVMSAVAAPRSLERAMETSTEAVVVPKSAPSSIDARGCLQCPAIRMEIPATARFFVGKDEVTLSELSDYAVGKSHDMVIFYELNANVVRRIVISGVLPLSTTR